MDAYFVVGTNVLSTLRCLGRNINRTNLTYRYSAGGIERIRVRSQAHVDDPSLRVALEAMLRCYGKFEGGAAQRAWVLANVFWRTNPLSPAFICPDQKMGIAALTRYFRSYSTLYLAAEGEQVDAGRWDYVVQAVVGQWMKPNESIARFIRLVEPMVRKKRTNKIDIVRGKHDLREPED